MDFILFIIISYLFGSIPNGLILSKIFLKKDPRNIGSGNIGATNVARTGGYVLGIITLILDVLKGGLPVYFAIKMNIHYQLPFFAGFFAFLGHLFPVYLKFQGGKGVATAIGVFAVLTPIAIIIDAFIFFLIFYVWRYVSLASIISAIFLPGILKLLIIFKIYQYDLTIIYLATIISILIIFKHKNNIQRLLKKEELKFGSKR